MKGIILAGGESTRLNPLTTVTSKQLLPVYDKPMVYYPLSTLMLAGIRDILIISTPRDLPDFQQLLGDGSQLGINISYAEQPQPEGLAQAFLIGRHWIGDEPCAMVLGDSIFYGDGFVKLLRRAAASAEDGMATVFGCLVDDPGRFNVVELDDDCNAVSIEEKPVHPKSNYAVMGLYFYPRDVCKRTADLKPSSRGELEIADLNRLYLNDGLLNVIVLERGFTWLETGTAEALFEASQIVRKVQQERGVHICVPEEIAYAFNWITNEQLLECAESYRRGAYADYLRDVATGIVRLNGQVE